VPLSYPVTLTWGELFTAMSIGGRRQIMNLKEKRKDRYGAKAEEGWTYHVEGACGEMATAKYAGVYWSGNMGDLKADDVGILQVRTRSAHHYDLPLHPEDPFDRPFILVTGKAPFFILRGWIMAGDGKRDEWWGEKGEKDRPAFWVPQSELRDMSELKFRNMLMEGTS
jgi:hypothetical protein